MPDLDAMGRALQPLLHQAYLLECGAVSLHEVLKWLDITDDLLLTVSVLAEVVGHELLLGWLHDLIKIIPALPTERIKAADVSFENLLFLRAHWELSQSLIITLLYSSILLIML